MAVFAGDLDLLWLDFLVSIEILYFTAHLLGC